MPAQHAPRNGATIRGVEYKGGQFVPGDVVDSLSDEEKKQAGIDKPNTPTGYEQNGEFLHGSFDPHLWNEHHAKVTAGLPEGRSERDRVIKQWPEFKDHEQRTTADPLTEALRDRVWKSYGREMNQKMDAEDRERAMGKPQFPPGVVTGYKSDGSRKRRYSEEVGERQFRDTRKRLNAEIDAEYGPHGREEFGKAVDVAYSRPLTPEEADELDAEVKAADETRGNWQPGGKEFGYRAAEQRIRLDAAADAVRDRFGPPADPQQADHLKALYEEFGDKFGGIDRYREMYADLLTIEEAESNPDDDGETTTEEVTASHDDAYDQVKEKLDAENATLDAGTEELNTNYSDYSDERLEELYDEAISEGEDDPATTAVDRYRKELAEPHAEFFEDYHAEDDPDARVEKFTTAVDEGKIKFGRLSDDEREILADDLAGQSDAPAALNSLIVSRFDVGDMSSDEEDLYTKALQKVPDGQPRAFQPGKRKYDFYNLEDAPDDERAELISQMGRVAGKVWESPDGSKFIMEDHGAGSEMTGDLFGGTYTNLNDADDAGNGWQHVFNALADETATVGESDVPAAARNFGRVSGGENASIGDDWNPNDVDVFKPVNKDFYLKRLGDANPDLADKHLPRYEVVPRQKTGQRVGLPPQFWEGMEERGPDWYDTTNDDLAAKITARRERQSGDQQKHRKEIRTEADRLKQFKKGYGELLDRHNQLLRREESAQAHEEKAGQARGEFNSNYTDSPGNGHPLDPVNGDLHNALDELETTAAGKPWVQDLELSHISELLKEAQGGAEGDDRKRYAKELKGAADKAEEEHETALGRVDQDHEEFDDHFQELGDRWQALHDKAVAAYKANREHARGLADDPERDAEEKDEGVTTEEARDSAKSAIWLAKLAKRQLRKLRRAKLNRA